MTDIIISFDTEDFTCNRAADGIYDIAKLLEEEGIRGCFNIVGLLAEQLVAWGRTDVLEALKYHEIETHSYGHSLHPCINEYTNTEDFQEAYRELIRQESAGIAAVKAATGAKRLYAACPPGTNESYVAMYGYHDLGIPCYAGELLDSPHTKGMFYCNQLYIFYYEALEDLVSEKRHLASGYLDRLAERSTVNFYNHPNRLLYSTSWDVHNYLGANLNPFGQWEEACRLTDEERKELLEGIRTFIRMLKADGRFRFVTYGQLVEARCGKERMLTREAIPGIREKLQQRFWPVMEPESLSIADIFAACVTFLRGSKLFAAGRVYGFLEEPYAITEQTVVQAADVQAAAAQIDLTTFLSPYIMVGETKVGPADFLFAMLDVLSGAEMVTLLPREQNLELQEFPRLTTFPLDKWIFAPDFKAEYLKKRAPLQAWTIRF